MIHQKFERVINPDGQVWKKLKTNNGLYYDYEVVDQLSFVGKTLYPNLGTKSYNLEGEDWDVVFSAVSSHNLVATKTNKSLWIIYPRGLNKTTRAYC